MVVVVVLGVRIAVFLGGALPWNHDGASYLGAARAVVAGQSPIGDVSAHVPPRGHLIPPYIYPPTLAVALAPLTLLPPAIADLVWLAMVAASCAALVWALSHWLGLAGAAVAVLGFVPTWDTFKLGQVNAFVAVAIALGVAGVGMRRDTLSGVATAAGALLKLTPAALGPVLAAERRWRALVVLAGVSGVVVLLTLPFVSAATWWAGLIAAAEQAPASPSLSSWPALVARFADVSPHGVSLLVSGVLLLVTLSRVGTIDPEAVAAAASVIPTLAAVLVWPHHAVMALPAIAVALARTAGTAAGTVPLLAWLAVDFFTHAPGVMPVALLAVWCVLIGVRTTADGSRPAR